MKFFVNKEQYLQHKKIFAFESKADQERLAPMCDTEVITPPSDYSASKYTYNFEQNTWVLNPGIVSLRCVKQNTTELTKRKNEAISKIQHYDIVGDSNMLNAWKDYYRQLDAIVISPESNRKNDWPSKPFS